MHISSLKTRLSARLALSDGARPIAANTGWLMGDKILRMLVGVLIGAWVARYLGPDQFGTFSYAIAFVAFFQAICTLGLDNIAIRDMARDETAAAGILGAALRLRLACGLVCWAAAIVGMALLRPGDSQALWLVAIVAGTVIFQSADTIDLWFQSRSQSKRTVAAKTTSLLLASAIRVGLILAQAPLIAFAIIMLVEAGFTALALAWAYRRYRAPDAWVWNFKYAQQMLSESWPYLVSAVAILFYMRIDQIMLREMIGTHEVGIYSAALPLSTAWYFIPMAICASVAPVLARKKERSESEYMTAISHLFSLMWWLSLPLCLIIALLSAPIINLLYGAAYTASAAVLAVHVFANVPVALGVAQSQWIANERRGSFALNRTVAGAVSNIILNLILIPQLGALGAAVGTLLAQVLAAICINIFLAPKIFQMQLKSLVRYA